MDMERTQNHKIESISEKELQASHMCDSISDEMSQERFATSLDGKSSIIKCYSHSIPY